MLKLLLGAVVSLCLLVVPAHADTAHFTYEFSITNAPGGIGDFSWEVTTLGLLQGSTKFVNFNQVSPPSTGGGCQITSVLLIGEAGGIGLNTFFSPLCLGLFDSETSGFAVNPGQVGVYTFSGTNPDDSKNFATFQVFQSHLPVTTPEPGMITLLPAGLLFLATSRRGVTALRSERS
jgi:hypothetical protein